MVAWIDGWYTGLGPGLQAVLTATWQASVLVLMVFALQAVFGRWLSPRWRYTLWSVVVIRLMLPVTPGSALSVFNLFRGDPEAVVVAELPTVSVAGSLQAFDLSGFEHVAYAAGVQPVEPASPWSTADIMLTAWLAGAASVLGVLILINIILALRLRRGESVDEPGLLDLVESCKHEIGVKQDVRLIVYPGVTSPALAGVFRPTLLIPPGLTEELPRHELRFILLHELAHVKKHDIAMNWLLIALSALHWFNPLVWFAFARLRADRELARDAMVLRVTGTDASQAYGQTIIRVLERLSRPRLNNPALAGIGDGMGQLKRRMRMISLAPKRRPAMTFIGVVLLAILAAIGLTDAAEPVFENAEVVEQMKTMGDLDDQTPQQLVQMLLDRDETQRREVLNQLTRMGTSGIDALSEKLAISKDRDRILIAYSIGEIGPDADDAIPALSDALGDGIGEAALSLVKVDPSGDRAIPILIKNLQGKPAYIVANALGDYGDRASDAVPALEQCLNSPDSILVVKAHAALVKITGEVDPHIGELINWTRSDSPSSVAHFAIFSLGDLGPIAAAAIPALEESLDDPRRWSVADRAIRQIKGSGPHQLSQDLIGTWRTPDGTPDPVVLNISENGTATIMDEPNPAATYHYQIGEDRLWMTREGDLLEFTYQFVGESLLLTHQGQTTEFVRAAPDNAFIEQKLREPMRVDFDQTTLGDAIEEVRDMIDVPLFINWEALKASGVDRDEMIKMTVITRSSDMLVLIMLRASSDQNKGLYAPAVKMIDGVLTASTVRDLDGITDIRVYDIRDLLVQVPDFDPEPLAPRAGGTVPKQLEREKPSHEELVGQFTDLIRETVGQHEEWAAHGGDFSSIDELNGNLVVKTSPENHENIMGLLVQLREARSPQISVESRFLLVTEGIAEESGMNMGFEELPGDKRIRFLDDLETHLIIRSTQASPLTTTLTLPRMTVSNGQKGYVTVQQQSAYASGFKQIEDEDGVAYEPVIKTINEGVLLQARATVSADRRYVTLTLNPTVLNLKHPIEKIRWKDSPLNKNFFIEAPEFTQADVEMTVSVPDKGTIMIDIGSVSGPMTGVGDAAGAVEEGVERHVYMLIKPTIILQPEIDQEFPGLIEE